MSSHFCLGGSFKLLTTGIGSTMIIRSVTILMLALENHDAIVLMHVPGTAGPRQKRSAGVHRKIAETTVATVKPTMIAMKLQVQIWKVRVWKTRWYCIRMASLVRPMEAQ